MCNVVIFLGAGGGLFLCLPWLRRPICWDFSTALDFCLHFCCFDVHSVALSCSFVGRPIRHSFLLLLDFCRVSRNFDVQSDAVSCSFWTSAVSPAALTSNLTRFLAPFGLLTCLSPLRSPTPTILLYLDALTSLIHKRIKAMPVYCYQHCSYLTYSILL